MMTHTTPTKLGAAAERAAECNTEFPLQSGEWTRSMLIAALESGDLPRGSDSGKAMFAFTSGLKKALGWTRGRDAWMEKPPATDEFMSGLRCPSEDIKSAMLSSDKDIDVDLAEMHDCWGFRVRAVYVLSAHDSWEYDRQSYEDADFKTKLEAIEALPRAICLAILKGQS